MEKKLDELQGQEKEFNKLWEEIKKKGNSKYKANGIEPIDLYRAGDMLRDFAIACIIKYAFRNRRDTGKEINKNDVEKIIHYAEMLNTL